MRRESSDDFFEEATGASRTKAQMVAEYFAGWAKVISRKSVDWGLNGKIRYGYADLYSGPGVYEDGTASTPILILEHILKTDELRQHTALYFNDARKDRVDRLCFEFNSKQESLDADARLEGPIRYSSYFLGSEVAAELQQFKNVPTLYFIDPFGVKGLTQNLVRQLICRRGSDCIFFFNYSKVNWHVSSDHYAQHVNALFGVERANELRATLAERNWTPHQREQKILEATHGALSDAGASRIAPFKFLDGIGSKTSHFLFLATKRASFGKKAAPAEGIWKSIANRKSTYSEQGIPLFIFSPSVDKAKSDLFQPLLNLGVGHLDELKRKILARGTRSTSLTVGQCIKEFASGTNIMPRNVKEALLALESDGHIKLGEHRRSKTRIQLAEDVTISFVRR